VFGLLRRPTHTASASARARDELGESVTVRPRFPATFVSTRARHANASAFSVGIGVVPSALVVVPFVRVLARRGFFPGLSSFRFLGFLRGYVRRALFRFFGFLV